MKSKKSASSSKRVTKAAPVKKTARAKKTTPPKKPVAAKVAKKIAAPAKTTKAPRAAKTAQTKTPRAVRAAAKALKPAPTAATARVSRVAPVVIAPIPSAPTKTPPPPKAAPHISPPPAPRVTPSLAPRVLPSPTPRRPLKIPPILLEGDASTPVKTSGPGSRYVLGPAPAAATIKPAGAELPESYGSRQLLLAARDPRWLYAHWDFTSEQLRACNAASADGHLVLRVHRFSLSGEPFLQIHLHPESRHWFVPVPYPASKYLAALGYYDRDQRWVEQAHSGATMTPPDSVAEEATVRFATIPIEIPFVQLLASVQAAVRTNQPLAEAVQQLRAEGFYSLPASEDVAGAWTPAQEKALAAVVSLDPDRRIWVGSVEVTELIRRQLENEASSITAAQFGLTSADSAPASPVTAFGAASSPGAPKPSRQRRFWFNVNAELIIYGSTEPDAVVSIGGREIKLRRDGSFSFRFALPDGQYDLPIQAHAADGEETRTAGLRFRRHSTYDGAVDAHPQDKTLHPPSASAVA
jgi:uncharacterized protein